MLLMPYSVATAGLSSVLSLTALSFPLYSSASSSTSGAIIRQGPHQGAQKSTRTGTSLFRTFSSQSASVTASAVPAHQERERESASGFRGGERGGGGATRRGPPRRLCPHLAARPCWPSPTS